MSTAIQPLNQSSKKYGTIEYEKGFWKIVCEPHVSIRLKRVFGKLSKGSTGKHLISDTPENARDITWFIARYPMHVKDEMRLFTQARKQREALTLVDKILAGGYTPPDFDLAIPARDYQKVAAAMLLARGGLLLADEVGIGKTAAGICTFMDPRTLPAVVVTLTHLPLQWKKEIARFAPKLTVHVLKSGRPYDIRMRESTFGGDLRFPDVVIMNYHKLAGWSETLITGGRIQSVIFDEGQELRKEDSQKYKAAEHLAHSAKFRLATTATPIYNYGSEWYSVLNILFPNELGTKSEFASEWCESYFGDKAKVKNPAAFGAYLRDSGMMLRRTRADVGRELPEAQSVVHYVESDPEALNNVSNACAELAKLILSGAKESERGEKMHASEELSNLLRQATGLAKAPYVAEFVRLLLESGEKVVLYGWHRAVYSVWLDKLAEFKPVLYTGSESIPQKEEAKRKFIDGETRLMIISLRSGAGLDGLQHSCRIVCFGELDWSPGCHEQCVGRVHRDGQKGSVLAYYLVSETGSDPTVSEVLGIKKQQIDPIRRNPGEEELVSKLQTDGGHIKRLAEAWLKRRA